jgi:hypothetical protein
MRRRRIDKALHAVIMEAYVQSIEGTGLATRWAVSCSLPSSVRNVRTIRTATAFSSTLYLRVMGFPATVSFGMTPSSFPRSIASKISTTIHRDGSRSVRQTVLFMLLCT